MISIHAPSRERLQEKEKGDIIDVISIHAPSRERPEANLPPHSHNDFNPRSLTGATIMFTNWDDYIAKFQSTLPHGSDMVFMPLVGMIY